MDANDTSTNATLIDQFPEVAYLGYTPDDDPLLIAFDSQEAIHDDFEVIAVYVLDSVQRVRRSVSLETIETGE